MIVEGTVSGRSWRLRPADPARSAAIAQRHGLPEILGRVLAGRGIEPGEVPNFLEPRLKDVLPDPSHLADLDRVAARLADAVVASERVGIVGDYDVDGATSTALAASWLAALGIAAEIVVPDRLADGYGANPAILRRLADAGCRLVLTLDNGTSAFEALAFAAAQGLEVIVVDHHAAEHELPPAYGIVNPNRADQSSPLGHLAAVGVTFVVLAAAARELRRRGFARPLPDLLSLLDLVALGTVCDVVPLDGVNRALVRQGLKVAARGTRPGLVALARAAGIETVEQSWHLSFLLGPRLNAGGRLGEPMLATRLLLATEPAEAAALASRLNELNGRRQALERSLIAAAEAAVQPQLDRDAPILLATGEAWHPGVLGIVASRLVERFGRPAFVVGIQDGVAKGSGRSVAGVDLGALVIAAKRAGLLREGGGHAMAAGITTSVDRLAAFAAFAAERIGPIGLVEPEPLELDGALAVAGVTPDLAQALDRLAPFGPGNAEPRFCLTDARIVELREVGRGHLACVIAGAAAGRIRGIAFRAGQGALAGALARRGEALRLAGRVKFERWRGEARVSFEIEDAAPG
ncbi:MAG: single-stranded-DNA-specific exonuclease RecJ [Geminicoccaceae bacterium]|nr:single-stranded-DNA-specific exonuclease RecJ [Geminicoccaceae bacterium]